MSRTDNAIFLFWGLNCLVAGFGLGALVFV